EERPPTSGPDRCVHRQAELARPQRRERARARLGGATSEDVNAKTTMLVVGAEGFGMTSDPLRSRSQKLIRAEELNAQQPPAPIQIVSEDQFCRLAGVSSPEAIRRQYYATRDLLARYRSLRDDHIRYLVKCGIIRPVLRTNA